MDDWKSVYGQSLQMIEIDSEFRSHDPSPHILLLFIFLAFPLEDRAYDRLKEQQPCYYGKG